MVIHAQPSSVQCLCLVVHVPEVMLVCHSAVHSWGCLYLSRHSFTMMFSHNLPSSVQCVYRDTHVPVDMFAVHSAAHSFISLCESHLLHT